MSHTQGQTIFRDVVSFKSTNVTLFPLSVLLYREAESEQRLEKPVKRILEVVQSSLTTAHTRSAVESDIPHGHERRRCRTAVPGKSRDSVSEAATRKKKAPEVSQTITPRRPQMDSTQDGSSRRVGTSHHSTQSIFSNIAEPGLCHVLPWLDWSELRQIQRFFNHLSEHIRLWCLSLASRQRQKANHILTYWNKKQRAQASRGADRVLAKLLTTRRDTHQLEMCCAQLRWEASHTTASIANRTSLS